MAQALGALGSAREGSVQHSGGCHCGAVTFSFQAATSLIAWDCNCSICAMKRNVHVIVPAADFILLTGEDSLTEYRFNTRVAVHLFCRICGVQAFYRPRSSAYAPDLRAARIFRGPSTNRTTGVFRSLCRPGLLRSHGRMHPPGHGAPSHGLALRWSALGSGVRGDRHCRALARRR